jgi:hypothetical protein
VSTIEDRLRAATQAIAATVQDGTAPELRLPPGRERSAARSGALLRWTTPISAAGAVAAVVADAGRLCRQQSEANTVRLLNPASPGHNLIADSKVVATVPRSAGGCFAGYAVITSDGKSVIGPISESRGAGSAEVAFGEFSASTHAPRLVQRQAFQSDADSYQDVLWPGSAGGAAIVQPAAGFPDGVQAEILRGPAVTALPWSDRIFAAAR